MSLITKNVNKVIDYFLPPVYIVSYPKAGRTWLRSLLAEIINPDASIDSKIELTQYSRYSPFIPTIIFTHSDYKNFEQKDFKFGRYRKVVVLMRDPRDILVSSYFEHTLRTGGYDKTKSLSDFMRDPIYGLEKIIQYYNSLLKNTDIAHIIHYENLSRSPKETLLILCKVIGLKDAKYINNIPSAISRCDFKRMQKKAKNSNNFRLKPTDKTNPESQKIRRGKVHGYTNYLSEKDQEFASDLLKKLDKRLVCQI